MRETQRTIVAALIFSKDGKLLMGQKDPTHGGVYPNAWHIPGGGVDENETFERALEREVKEETGIDISLCRVVPLNIVRNGSAERTLQETEERVLCHMTFNYFEVYIDDKNADDIDIRLGDDLVEAKWFDRKELLAVEHVPGGKEFFEEMGYI